MMKMSFGNTKPSMYMTAKKPPLAPAFSPVSMNRSKVQQASFITASTNNQQKTRDELVAENALSPGCSPNQTKVFNFALIDSCSKSNNEFNQNNTMSRFYTTNNNMMVVRNGNGDYPKFIKNTKKFSQKLTQ